MKRDHLVFLIAGVAFGFLAGFAVSEHFWNRDGDAEAAMTEAGPSGPATPRVGGSGGEGESGAPSVRAGMAMQRIGELQARIDENPKDGEAFEELGFIYSQVRMFEEAVGFYREAIEIGPETSDLWTHLGSCLQQLRDYDGAYEAYDRAQELDGSHWESVYNEVVLAGIFAGDHDRAQDSLDRLLAINPNPPDLAALREALARSRERDEAGGGGESAEGA